MVAEGKGGFRVVNFAEDAFGRPDTITLGYLPDPRDYWETDDDGRIIFCDPCFTYTATVTPTITVTPSLSPTVTPSYSVTPTMTAPEGHQVAIGKLCFSDDTDHHLHSAVIEETFYSVGVMPVLPGLPIGSITIGKIYKTIDGDCLEITSLNEQTYIQAQKIITPDDSSTIFNTCLDCAPSPTATVLE